MTGAGLHIARLAGLFFMWGAALMFILTASARAAQLQSVALRNENAIIALRLSTGTLPLVVAIADTALFLVYFIIANVIFLRRSNDRLALLTSVMLATMAATIVRPPESVRTVEDPLLRGLYLMTLGVSYLALSTYLHLFPDTRFVPRWTGWLAVFWGTLNLGWLFAPPLDWPPRSAPLVLTGLWVTSSVCVQLYRYLRVSSAEQRQQTKWILFGLLVAAVGFLAFNVIAPVLAPAVLRPGVARVVYVILGVPLEYAALVALPLAFAFSILRYRLWDVDRIAYRAVVYSVMTGGLLALYFGCVLLLQQLFRALTGANSVLAIVISTIAIALLFQPLRQAVQAAIDRRTYRRKYDAAQTLQRFGEIARDEMDLNVITRELVAAVNETMQTEHASVWIKRR
jgi:hypothetical protein